MKLTFLVLFLSLNVHAQADEKKEAPAPEGEKKEEQVFSTGPYKEGVYRPTIGEEERQSEEAVLEENRDETRVNKMGPNKR